MTEPEVEQKAARVSSSAEVVAEGAVSSATEGRRYNTRQATAALRKHSYNPALDLEKVNFLASFIMHLQCSSASFLTVWLLEEIIFDHTRWMWH